MTDESTKSSAPYNNKEIGSELFCPLCGGKAVNLWKKISIILFFGFLIFAVLGFISFAVNCASLFSANQPFLGILFLVFLGLSVLFLFFSPVTGAMAVSSRSRCKKCGHRFWSIPYESNLKSDVNFPEKFNFISILILLVLFFIQIVYLSNISGY